MSVAYHVGIDVGGTFTDVCVADEDGAVSMYKTPSTPDVGTGVLNGLKIAAQSAGLELPAFLAQVERFGHGSTVAVNALLERRGVRTGLITTRGFGDTLWIARMMAMTTGLPPQLWTHYRRRNRPDPLMDRRLVREVDERVDYRGDILVPLEEERARRCVVELLDAGIEALAVCTLWSFRNPIHERLLKRVARELAPDLYVTVSSELVPVVKEYERMATTVGNAYLGPVVQSYLTHMKGQLLESRYDREFFLFNSTGGVIPVEEAADKPIQLLGSGPSGGVLAARHLARRLGQGNVVTADMGGTSFDVGLIVDGEPAVATEAAVGNLNLLNPMLDIRSIGCGGGSIARAESGVLKVGPESAGSFPGPVCYGRGGERATVTDADLVLGYLNSDAFPGATMRLDREAAAAAIQSQVARPLGLSLVAAAAGIRRVADNQMADLLRQSALERGHDPSDFHLMVYGGAGPLHAAAFDLECRYRSIVIPLAATVFSAHGILTADMRISRQRSVLQRTAAGAGSRAAGLDGAELESVFAELEAEASQSLHRYASGRLSDAFSVRRSVGMRYARQVHQIQVPVTEPAHEDGVLNSVLDAFERLYRERFGGGTGSSGAVIEITTCYIDVVRVLPKAEITPPPARGRARPAGVRRIYADDWLDVPVYRRPDLPVGFNLHGPALIDDRGTTVWIDPDRVAGIDGLGNVVMEAKS